MGFNLAFKGLIFAIATLSSSRLSSIPCDFVSPYDVLSRIRPYVSFTRVVFSLLKLVVTYVLHSTISGVINFFVSF
jgi:hypothetical protein